MVGRISTMNVSGKPEFKHSILRTILRLHGAFKKPRRQVTQRIHGDNLLLVGPLGERTNVGSRLGVGKIGSASFQLLVFRESLFGWGLLKQGEDVREDTTLSSPRRDLAEFEIEWNSGDHGLPVVKLYLLAGYCKSIVYRIWSAVCCCSSIKLHMCVSLRCNAPPMAEIRTQC